MLKYHTVSAILFLSSLQTIAFGGISTQAELIEAWQSWREIKSLTAEGYKIFIPFNLSNVVQNRSQMREFVLNDLAKKLAGTTDSVIIDELQKITSPLTTGTLRFPSSEAEGGYVVVSESTLANWKPYSLAAGGGLVRNDTVAEGMPNSIVRGSDHEILYEPSFKQASKYPGRSPLKVDDINTYVFTPDLEGKHEEFKLEGPKDGTLTLSSKLRSFYIDSENGFISRMVRFRSNGEIASEVYQLLPVTLDTGAVVPKLIAELSYSAKEGRVATAKFHVISKISANGDINPDRFDVAVPGGTNIVDFSEMDEVLTKEFKSPQWKAEVAASDVRSVNEFINRPDFAAPGAATFDATVPFQQHRSSYLRLAFITANVIAIVVLIALVYRRMIRARI